MAVLGGKKYNSDPRVLLRTSTANAKISYLANGSQVYSGAAAFWTTNGIFHDGLSTSTFSANTAKQILSISGSSGFMYGAISPQQNSINEYVTWTIVVDGVSYSIVQGQGTKDDTSNRWMLGSMFMQLNATLGGQTWSLLNMGTADPAWDDAHGSINQSHGSGSHDVYMGLPSITGDADQKVFFANSLVVSCTPTSVPSSGISYSNYAGVIYQLL